MTELYNGVMITTDGGAYFVNGHCDCKAGALSFPCKHRAAKRLLEMYEEAQAASPTDEREELIRDITSTWSRKYPGERLADSLMARFKVNNLSLLATGWLHDFKAALA